MAATIETKVTEKVAYFQELKAGMNGKIKIESEIYVHSLVEDVLGVFKKNELKSENAGYEIHENADGDGLSFLGDRVEINLASGESFNVWIDKIACYAEKYALPFLGFMRDTAIEKGDSNITDFWTNVIEYRLKDHKDAEMWRKILGLESDGNAEITACLDDYFVNSDDATDVEIENEINNRLAEEKKRQDFIKSVLNIYGDKKIKLIPQKNLGSAAYLTARKVEFNDFDYRKMSDGLYHIRICRDGHYYAFSTLATYETEEQVLRVIRELGAAIWRGDETFTFLEVEEVTAEKNPLKEKIADLKAAEKIISEKYLSLCRSLYVKIDGEYQSAFGFDDYVTKYHDTFYSKEGNDYVEDTAAYRELKEIEREWNALFKELEYFENIEEKAEILKSKIAEQKSHPHKGIDWKATFEDMQISEILNLQKDLKKFLKLGQIDLAENVFSMLKTLCRNYREQVAA